MMSTRQAATQDRFVRLAAVFDRAKQGERAAMDEMVRELTPLLWHVARTEGLDEQASADVVQTTWMTLLTALHGIHSPIALTSWLITVTKREAWHVRGARKAEPLDEQAVTQLPDPAERPEEWVVAQDQRRLLWLAVAQLSERCQRLLRVVAYAHRPSYDEVGVAMGMRRGSIGPTRGRCLAKLRAVLATMDESDAAGSGS